MKKLVHKIGLALMLSCVALPVSAFKVVDSLDKQPIVAATVHAVGGAMLGMTNSDGDFDASTAQYPLVVQCMGYEPFTVTAPVDIVALSTKYYELPETQVSSLPKDGLHITCYMREMSTMIADGDTTIAIFEQMADVILPNRPKVKGFKGHSEWRVGNKRKSVLHRYHNGTDSIARESQIPSLMMLSPRMDTLYVDEIDSLRNVESGFFVSQKKKSKLVERKTSSTYSFCRDNLAGYENHVLCPAPLKLLGMTMDITDFYVQTTFLRNGTGIYRTNDWMSFSYVIGGTARGKMWKKMLKVKSDIRIQSTVEIFPVDFEFLTVEECRELEKEKNVKMDFVIPRNIMPFSEAQQSIIDRCNPR